MSQSPGSARGSLSSACSGWKEALTRHQQQPAASTPAQQPADRLTRTGTARLTAPAEESLSETLAGPQLSCRTLVITPADWGPEPATLATVAALCPPCPGSPWSQGTEGGTRLSCSLHCRSTQGAQGSPWAALAASDHPNHPSSACPRPDQAIRQAPAPLSVRAQNGSVRGTQWHSQGAGAPLSPGADFRLIPPSGFSMQPSVLDARRRTVASKASKALLVNCAHERRRAFAATLIN